MPPQMMSPRDQAIAMERAAGQTVTEIADRHGISHQRVSVIVAQVNELIDWMQRDLESAQAHGNVVAYLVPFSVDYTLGIAFGQWVVDRLRARGMQIEVT